MRASVVLVVLFNVVALSVAGKFNLLNPATSPLSYWDTKHSQLLEQPAQNKRDVIVDSKFTLHFDYVDATPAIVPQITTKKLQFNGVRQRVGTIPLAGVVVDVTPTRHNNDGETQLVFDYDFHGKDVLPSNAAIDATTIDSISIQVEGIDSTSSTDSVTTYLYLWTYTNTGKPSFALSYVDSSNNDGTTYTDSLDLSKEYGIVRVVIVKQFTDTISGCATSIDKYSLLESACIPPRKDGSLVTSAVQVGQLFQNAPAGLLGENFSYKVKNCYGYDKKICQVKSNDFVQFDESTQTFNFEKPCAGVKSEYGCATTVEVSLRAGECEAVHSTVIIPQNERAIQNKYGEAQCRVVSAYEAEIDDSSKVSDLIDGESVEISESCAHLEGCYPVAATSDFSGIDVSGLGLVAPFTPAQCRAVCLDAEYNYFYIGDAGNYCGCSSTASYISQAAVALSSCNTDCANPDAAGEKCGDNTNRLVYNIESCTKVAGGYNFD